MSVNWHPLLSFKILNLALVDWVLNGLFRKIGAAWCNLLLITRLITIIPTFSYCWISSFLYNNTFNIQQDNSVSTYPVFLAFAQTCYLTLSNKSFSGFFLRFSEQLYNYFIQNTKRLGAVSLQATITVQHCIFCGSVRFISQEFQHNLPDW